MSLKTIFHHIAAIFSNDNLNAVEHFVAKVSPTIGADLATFMDSLPDVFASLREAAEKAKQLVKDAHGIEISTTLAIAVAQNVFGARSIDIVKEAEAALKKL